MLYNCVECGREIASDAGRCPYCGTKEAGHRAICAHGAGVHYSDPNWREREKEKEARDKANSDRLWNQCVAIVGCGITFGAGIGALSSPNHFMVGGIVGGIVGLFFGIIAALALILSKG